MSKFLILECNRLRGNKKFSQINDEDDKFKNKWTNVVSSSGIVINKGDSIALDQIIVNSRGASDEVMEFGGEKNENNLEDNKTRLEYSFYINHNASNTCRLPHFLHSTYRGNGTIMNPTKEINPDTPQFHITNGLFKNGNLTIADSIDVLSKRSLGETFFAETLSTNIGNENIQIDQYGTGGYLIRLEMYINGTGRANVNNSGYTANVVYPLEPVNPQGATYGTGLSIRVLNTTTSGDIFGVITNWRVENLGQNYQGNIGLDFKATLPTYQPSSGSPQPNGTEAILRLHAYPDIAYSQTDLRRFDGKRFFPLNIGYSGLANDEEGVSARTPTIDTAFLESNMDKRKKTVDLEVAEGFLTPDNVGTILTDQLHEPSYLNKKNNIGSFVDYTDFIYEHTNPDGFRDSKGTPFIVETPTYAPTICNAYGRGIKGTPKPTLSGYRKIFYNSVAYADMNRVSALKNLFYNFKLDLPPVGQSDHRNDIIMSGRGNELDNQGDYGNLKCGDLGARVCCLNNFKTTFPAPNHNKTKYERNAPIISNLKWTQSNITRIIKSFKQAEEYTGNLKNIVDTNSQDFHDKMAICLDLCMYDDEYSTQFPKVQGSPSDNQRFKFSNNIETVVLNFAELPVDFDHNDSLVGFQRDFNNLANDGQQLSQIWIRSRFQEGFCFGNSDTVDNSIFLTDFQNQNDTGLLSLVAGSSMSNYFKGNWTDENNVLRTEHFCFQQARENDLAIIPFFPKNPTSSNSKIDALTGNMPLIAFINRYNIGNSTASEFDTTNLDNVNNTWVIDLSNIAQGCQMGFDPSFTRNEAVLIMNPRSGNITDAEPESQPNLCMIGAVNPTINFNPSLSRFEFSGLSTSTNIGNGLITDELQTLVANDNPQEQCIFLNRSGQICPSKQKSKLKLQGAQLPILHNFIALQPVSKFSYQDPNLQEEGSVLDSQSGICLESLSIPNSNGQYTQITESNKQLYQFSLFDKMGFEFNQLFPQYGTENAKFVNQFIFQGTNPNYEEANQIIVKPTTTGAFISSGESQAFSSNELNMPLFNLGTDNSLSSTAPEVSAGAISAFKLPTKLTYPYLCVYSSIPSNGTDTEYVGGIDGMSKLSCMGYLTRQNNEGDYFFNASQTFDYTATKDFVLSEIETDIRLPDGSRPKLEPHSAVIFRIEKPIISIQNEDSIHQPVRTLKKKSK